MFVKIKCPQCETHYKVSGVPIRGQAVVEETTEDTYMEMNSFEFTAWNKWFWRCQSAACELIRSVHGQFAAGLEYYVGEPTI